MTVADKTACGFGQLTLYPEMRTGTSVRIDSFPRGLSDLWVRQSFSVFGIIVRFLRFRGNIIENHAYRGDFT